MNVRLRISFHGVPASVVIEQRIRSKASKLDAIWVPVLGCHASIEGPQRLERNGGLWSARVEVTIASGEVIASRQVGRDHAHESVNVAIGEAFAAVYRRIADRVPDGLQS